MNIIKLIPIEEATLNVGEMRLVMGQSYNDMKAFWVNSSEHFGIVRNYNGLKVFVDQHEQPITNVNFVSENPIAFKDYNMVRGGDGIKVGAHYLVKFYRTDGSIHRTIMLADKTGFRVPHTDLVYNYGLNDMMRSERPVEIMH